MAAFNSRVDSLVDIPLDKIDVDNKFKLITEIDEFSWYEKKLILKMVKKQKWSNKLDITGWLSLLVMG